MNLAKVLGLKRVSFIEFGVAGGNGLVTLERIAQTLQSIFGLEVDIYGFDAVSGMPKSKDYRDLPNLLCAGHYPMNQDRLRQRLKKSKLLLGMVEATIAQFIDSKPAPIAFVAFDFCFYSSTMNAFKVLEADQSVLLPRVHCFFRNIRTSMRRMSYGRSRKSMVCSTICLHRGQDRDGRNSFTWPIFLTTNFMEPMMVSLAKRLVSSGTNRRLMLLHGDIQRRLRRLFLSSGKFSQQLEVTQCKSAA
jgi:hypothetical protein